MKALPCTRLALAVSLCTLVPLAAQAPLAAPPTVPHPQTSPTAYPVPTPAAAVAPDYPVSPPQFVAVGPAQLPPEILLDRHLVRVDRLLADDDYATALTIMDEIIKLQKAT